MSLCVICLSIVLAGHSEDTEGTKQNPSNSPSISPPLPLSHPPPPLVVRPLWQYARLGAMLTHSCSLGYNGAILQALAVHLSLQGALALPQDFLNTLITEMEEVEKDESTLSDARV